MQLTSRVWVATLLSSGITLTNLAAAQAGDYSPVWRTMKPLYAVVPRQDLSDRLV